MISVKIRILLLMVIVVAIFFLAIIPTIKGRANNQRFVEWSEVVDDPEKHLTFNIISFHSPGWQGKESFAVKLLEERFNITLNYDAIDRVSFNNKGPLAMAAGIIPDVFPQSYSVLSRSAQHGFIMPLPTEVIIKYAPTFARILRDSSDLSWIAGRVNNQQYCLPMVQPTRSHPYPGIWRKDWLDAVGIKKIPDTIDEFTAAFEIFQESKPDARSFISAFSGVLDEDQKKRILEKANPVWGMSGDIHHYNEGMFSEIFGAFNVQPFQWILIDGDLQWGGIQPESKKALEQLKIWRQMGYIHPDFVQDHHSREAFQKLYSGITGYMSRWATYIELHPDRERIRTMARLQRERDIEMLEKLGKTEVEINRSISNAENNGRYVSLWTSATIPAGPGGHRGIRMPGAIGDWTEPFVFGAHLKDEPEKVIRWLRMVETVLNDEELMIQLSIGKRGLHWDWQAPNDSFIVKTYDQDSVNIRTQYGDFYFSVYQESTIVALPPYDGWLSRRDEGLFYDLWGLDISAALLGVPLPWEINKRHQSKQQLEWNQTYRNKKFADIGVFSDAESIVPSKVAPLLKRIIAYQQTAYAEFISGNRNLNEWDEFVEQFQKIGGSKVLETMRGYYKSMKIINSQVDSIFVSLIQ